MHVHTYPPLPTHHPDEEVEDNLRLAYRAPPPRSLPPRLEELLDRIAERSRDLRSAPSRMTRRA